MNKNLFNRISAVALSGLLAVPAVNAIQGAPHTVTCDNVFSKVTLNWKAPESARTLQWHDGTAYNGDSGESVDPQKPITFYVSSLFEADDLKPSVGEKIKSITYYQYVPAYKVTALVYKDGVVVAEADADASKYVKGKTLEVVLPQPVDITAGSQYRFALKFVCGSNFSISAVKDSATDAPGKGDLFSNDGVNWTATGQGDYFITANLENNVDETPEGYNVYRGETKLNDNLLDATGFVIEDDVDGLNSYTIAAVYGDTEIKSYPVTAEIRGIGSCYPTATPLSAKVDNLNVALTWAAPLLGGQELTWSDKTLSKSVGGTATSNTKIWVKNEFSVEDLIAFAGSKLTAVNFMFTDTVVSDVTVFIYEDGAMTKYEKVSKEQVKAIKAGEWTKFTLTEPVDIKAGHSYAYGLYLLHTPKTRPLGVSGGVTINSKGNCFSTSSPSSSNFLKSKPSWKTLASGGIDGNWMMTADIQDSPAPLSAPVYDVYRDGQMVKSDLAVTETADTVADLGTYYYSIVAKSGDRVSAPIQVKVNVALPPAYSAPLIEAGEMDPTTKEVSIKWNMDKELRHCGDPQSLISFEEEMSLMWGSQFTSNELADYAGSTITKLKFMIGQSIGAFKLGVYTKQGVALSEIEIPDGVITPQAVYTIELPQPVDITGTQDLILAYSGTIPAGAGGIIIDGGPLVDGGSRISFTNGATWINLGTLNSSYNNYNIFITAMVSSSDDESSSAPLLRVGGDKRLIAMPTVEADLEFGIQTDATAQPAAVVSAPVKKVPKTAGFNIYRNGELIKTVTAHSFTETLNDYGLFTYYVTAKFDNGWESKPSEDVVISNTVAQKAIAPFALTGEVLEEDLALSWQSPDKADVLTYATGNTDLGLGMTGSGTRSSYCVIKVPAAELESNVGNKISHIQFGLYSVELKSAAVIVMYGENIVYQQSVPVSSLSVGLNDVRLNEPVVIPEGTDVCIGYFVTYVSGIKPLGMDESAANEGYGDLISSTAASGYWYSLKSRFSMDHNWRIYGIISTPDRELPLRNMAKAESDEQPSLAYNVYCNGELLAENLTQETFTVTNAKTGRYYVTAVRDGAESGESNVVSYTKSSGVVEVEGAAEGSLTYDANTETIMTSTPSDIAVYSAAGALVTRAASTTAVGVAHLPAGVYVVTAQAAGATTSIKIVR